MMPIDLAAIARAYSPIRAASDRLVGAFTPLGPWLIDRLAQMRVLEQRTRAFPVIAFEGRAITARTAPAQRGVINNYGSIGSAIAAPFVAFGRGFIRIGQAGVDEMILPNLLGAIRDMLRAIDAQIGAFATPRSDMFDPRNARAGQLFGLAGMAWRALVSSTGQLRDLAGDIATVRTLLGVPAAAAPAPAAAPAAPGTPAADIPRWLNAEPLDNAVRYIVAALIVVPALPDLIQTALRTIWSGARFVVLILIQAIEDRLNSLRRQALSIFFTDMPRRLRKVPAMMTMFGFLIIENIQHFMQFAQLYFELSVDVLHDFLNEVRDYINNFIGIINTVLGAIDTILDFDLLVLIRPALSASAFILDYFGVRFTINDLLDAAGTAVNTALYTALSAAVFTARGATELIPGASGRAARRAVDLVGRIIDALFTSTGTYPDETAAPRLRRIPNLYRTLIGARGAAVGRAVATWGAQLAGDFAAIVGVGAQALTGLGEIFAAAAADFARTGPSTGAFARDAAAAANGPFDDQVRTLGERQSSPPGAIERWLAADGFAAIGSVIPIYVEAMRRFWNSEAAVGRDAMVEITPTSPHILARRAVLGRVHFARLEIHAAGRTIDEGLVRETAQHFQRAVQDAYAEGQRRLATAAVR